MSLSTLDHDGLTLTVHDHAPSGPPRGVVVALHGFPQTAAMWSGVRPTLVEAGYRVVAPDQRGYSPGARPRGSRAYRQSALVGDVAALVDAVRDDAGDVPVHLLGHDWGGALAWSYAAAHPDRLASLTVLSTPHPAALRAAAPHGQALRSWYIAAFQVPRLPELVVRAAGGQVVRRALARSGMDTLAVDRAAGLLADPATASAALGWYRGLRHGAPAAGPVRVPTLYVWGARDRFLGRAAAQRTGDHVDAAYRFEPVEQGTHWLAEQAPGLVADLLLEHLAAHPGRVAD